MIKCISEIGVILQPALIAILFIGVQSKCNRKCVPLVKCSNNFGRVNLSDLRVGAESNCDHYLEVCCSERDIINEKDSSKKPGELTKKFLDCGIRNVDGVGFRVSDATQKESQFGEFPWMVALLEVKSQLNSDEIETDRKYLCGGSLIEPNVVVTAAHCVSKKRETDLIVRAGEWDSKTTNEILPHQERTVDRIIFHENYNHSFLFNDIALLFLEEPFHPDEHIQLLCLLPRFKSFDSHENCIATGWGKDRFDSQNYQTILKKVQLPIVAHSECQTSLRSTRLGESFKLHESFLCAGGAEGVDTCIGDGGSPLVCPSIEDGNIQYQLAGIFAWGIGCGESGVAGVYVNSSMFYDWIFRTTELYGLEKELAEVEAKRI